MARRRPNKLTDSQRAQYYAAYVQADAALHQAEQRLEQAQIDADQARQAEALGVQTAEQQVTHVAGRAEQSGGSCRSGCGRVGAS